MKWHSRLVLIFVLALPGAAKAQFENPFNPRIAGIPVFCTSYMGQPVAFVPNPMLNDVGRATPGMPPRIELNPMLLMQLPVPMQLFWYGHECAHHVLGPMNSESNADCWSIQTLKRQRLATREDVVTMQSYIARTPGSPWGHLPGPARAQLFMNCFDQAPAAMPANGQEAEDPTQNADGQMSHTCRFTWGPRKGQQQSYPHLPAVPVGMPCNDGMGSSGSVVADTPPSSTPKSPVVSKATSKGVKRWRFCSHIPNVSQPTSSGHISKKSCEREREKLLEENAEYEVTDCVLSSSEDCSSLGTSSSVGDDNEESED